MYPFQQIEKKCNLVILDILSRQDLFYNLLFYSGIQLTKSDLLLCIVAERKQLVVTCKWVNNVSLYPATRKEQDHPAHSFQTDQPLYCWGQLQILILVSPKLIMDSSRNRRWTISLRYFTRLRITDTLGFLIPKNKNFILKNVQTIFLNFWEIQL